MPFDIQIVPRLVRFNKGPAKKMTYGEIYVVEESLMDPYHRLFRTALDAASVQTSPTCREIVERVCGSTKLSTRTTTKAGKGRPGIMCPPPRGLWGDGGTDLPWVFLMGTFDGEHESLLPDVFRDWVVPVSTNKTKGSGLFIHTTPRWRTSKPCATQQIVTIPMTTDSGGHPKTRWLCVQERNKPYSVPDAELNKLIEHSRVRLTQLSAAILRDDKYLEKVTEEIQNHEKQYRRKKRRAYAASRKSVNANAQQ
ncbi:hypothetical protein EDD18DRAFT_1337771 [Armillaria luteobubalina]|uniref:Uncharacterized protein n=1 Tax=Armillaria luteobubalina TaxID=153913 RepID=A0AA39UGL3_9AGAR|nr:hypothetical protein EDD18DRAFT_1337771 [Armillaria luteobubalina]